MLNETLNLILNLDNGYSKSKRSTSAVLPIVDRSHSQMKNSIYPQLLLSDSWQKILHICRRYKLPLARFLRYPAECCYADPTEVKRVCLDGEGRVLPGR